MAFRYDIHDSDTVADGTYITSEQSANYESGVFVIAFYDAAGNAVTPTAGTIKSELSPIEGQFLEPSSGDVLIDATTVNSGLATYTMPRFNGPAIGGRIVLTGITGATSFAAYFWRY